MAKMKLVENNVVPIQKDQVEIYNEIQLVEAKGKKFECRGIIRDVEVTRFKLNANNRLYPKKLWEKVLQEESAEGTKCYANHPDEEDVTKLVGIWHNFKINKESATADLYCIGDNGSLLLESLKAGSRGEGFSTVGYGEEETRTEEKRAYSEAKDAFIVRWDTFELQRLSDWVDSPSQNVYATINNISESEEKGGKLEDKFTNKKQEEIIVNNDKKEVIKKIDHKEVKNMTYTPEQLTERNHVKVLLSTAKKNDNLKESIEALKGIEISPEHTDLREQVDSEITKLYEKLDAQRDEAEKTLEETRKELEETKTQLDEVNEKYEKAKSIIEKVGVQEDTEEVENLQEKVKIYEENQEKMLEDIKLIEKAFKNDHVKELGIVAPKDIIDLAEDTKKRDEDIQALIEDTEKRDSDIQALLEDREAMLDDIKQFKDLVKEMEEVIKEREDKLEELGFEFVEAEDDKDKDEEEKTDANEMDDDEEVEEEKKDKKKKEESYRFKFKDGRKFEEQVQKSDDIASNSEVRKLVEYQIKKNPSLKDIEKELKECATIDLVLERIELFETKSDDKPVKFTETSTKERPSWLGNRL